MSKTKEGLIKSIIDSADIHHNISTLGMNLPEAPENCSSEIFWLTCSQVIDDFIDKWLRNPATDKGNRNLCECRKYYPEKIRQDGACQKHDFWGVYQHGRTGATLYWDKYWKSENSGFYFKYTTEELEEMTMYELKKMLKEINQFNHDVADMMTRLPAALIKAYKEDWARQEEEARQEAMGYNKTLKELLENANPQIVRLAKGIKKELTK